VPGWGDILQELQISAAPRPAGIPDFDGVRRRYLALLHAYTGRNVILYATDWLTGGNPQSAISITLEDVQAMMEVCRGLSGTRLDLILHSPGGSAEATASIVRYLRHMFDDIRVFVPLAAMSAATMWALASDQIVMGKHSQLGPIDPQFNGEPARGIIEGFEKAKKECSADPRVLGAWLPILQKYTPALIERCEKADELSKGLVREWLEAYMFKGDDDATTKANRVAEYFGDYALHRSHGLGISREAARGVGVVVFDLEDNPQLQDAVLSVHHAAYHTLTGPAFKIVENHFGRGFFKLKPQQIQIPIALSGPVQPGGPGGPQPTPVPQPVPIPFPPSPAGPGPFPAPPAGPVMPFRPIPGPVTPGAPNPSFPLPVMPLPEQPVPPATAPPPAQRFPTPGSTSDAPETTASPPGPMPATPSGASTPAGEPQPGKPAPAAPASAPPSVPTETNPTPSAEADATSDDRPQTPGSDPEDESPTPASS